MIDENEAKSSQRIAELAGRRTTSQRKLVLDLIRQSEGHLDADEIYRRAKERNPRISFSTVYRSLQLFKKLGLIEERHLAEEHHHYEAKSPSEHYHLVCLMCGEVVEFESPLIKRMKDKVRRERNFQITDVEVHFKGYCPKCLEREGGKEAG